MGRDGQPGQLCVGSNEGKKSRKSKKTNSDVTLTIGWWNGGGSIQKRLMVNVGLKNFLNTMPDIFSYGESAISNSQGLSLDG